MRSITCMILLLVVSGTVAATDQNNTSTQDEDNSRKGRQITQFHTPGSINNGQTLSTNKGAREKNGQKQSKSNNSYSSITHFNDKQLSTNGGSHPAQFKPVPPKSPIQVFKKEVEVINSNRTRISPNLEKLTADDFIPSFGPFIGRATLPKGPQQFNNYDHKSNTYTSRHHQLPQAPPAGTRNVIPVSEYSPVGGHLLKPFQQGQFRFRGAPTPGSSRGVRHTSIHKPKPTSAYYLTTFG